MRLVIDASVVVKWFFPDPTSEPYTEQALSVLQGIHDNKLEILQPPHWLAEVASVIVRLDQNIATQAIDLLDAMEFPISNEATVYKRAAEIAMNYEHHLFDTLYHAVAMQNDSTLITADRRYFNKTQELGQMIYLSEWSR